jgi:copper transport protein
VYCRDGSTVSGVTITAASVPLTTPGLWLTGLERAAMLIGLAVALGGLAGRGVARYYRGPRPTALPAPWALRGSLLGLAAAAVLAITAVAGPTLAARLARPPAAGLGGHATETIAIVEAICFALAAIALWLHRPRLSILPLMGVVLAEGIRGHPEGILPAAGALVTYCHLLPAVIWVGMLLYTLRAAVAWRGHPAAMRSLIALYARAAGWLFTMVVITGIIAALILVPVGSLVTTGYGLFLIAKAAIVCVVAGLAIAGQRWLRRTAAPADGPALATRLELAGLGVVLVVTGILTVMTPPAKPF